MIFLKSIELEGFKSYGKYTNIIFNAPFICLVGENGSGKSNVVDAIKWALGENSNKELRGENQDDILFKGSKKIPKAEEAKVTLFLSNENNILNIKQNDFSITRIYKRNSDTSQYFLNDEPVKRKDIINLFLDTGLSKGSLGIIAQGMIQEFVNAKPEDRRKIFEDAAGIGKYIKTKNENLVELEKVQDDLEKLNLTLSQYKSNINKLNKQAEIAKRYLDIKNNLEEKELAFCKKTYQINKTKHDEITGVLLDKKKNFDALTDELQQTKNKYTHLKDAKLNEDKKLAILNENKINLLEEISALSSKKAAYELNLKNQLSSNDKKTRIVALKENLSNLKNEIIVWENNLFKYNKELKDLEQQKNELNKKISNQNTNYNTTLDEFLSASNQVSSLKNLIENEYANLYSVKTLLDNKDALAGLIDTIKHLIKKVDNKHALAVETALGRNINNLVTETVDDAKKIIEFLKKNNAGTASFMPLNGIKSTEISNSVLNIAKSFAGFINTADNLVSIDDKYRLVIKTLIGNTLIVDNLNTANLLAKSTNYLQRIITLEGDIIKPGGIITGGSYKKKISTFNLQEQYDKANENLEALKEKKQEINTSLNTLTSDFNRVNLNYNNCFSNVINAKDKIENIKQQIQQTQNELSSLNVDNVNEISEKTNELVAKFAILETRKNEINSQFEIQSKICADIEKEYDELSNNLENMNNDKFNSSTEINDLEKQLLEVNGAIDEAKNIANRYKKTIDFILENITDSNLSTSELEKEIIKLKSEIEAFGPINMQAIQELQDMNQKYDELNKNVLDVQKAETDLKNIIESIDKEVTKIFKDKIAEINNELPNIFSVFKKHEKCQLFFTDPQNLLTTGIDVEITHENGITKKLRSLSGGEKSVISLSILLAVLKTSKLPLVVLDEVDSALDKNNSELLAALIKNNIHDVQFLFITHEDRTMVESDLLLGFAMQEDGTTFQCPLDLRKITNDK